MSAQGPGAGERDGGRPRLADAVISGFVATGASTVVLVVAYLLANAAGQQDGNILTRWFWELTHNSVVSFSQAAPAAAIGVHVAAGLGWALLYAYVAAPRLQRDGWQAGALYALIPWLASLFIFLPLTGAGVVGLNLGAGPLPALGNLVLHLIFGAVLGALYSRRADAPDTAEGAPDRSEPLEQPAMQHSEGVAAAGILGGLLVGALLGLAFAVLLPPRTGNTTLEGWSVAVAIGGALAGGAVGAMVGTFSGLPQAAPDPAELQMGPDPFERSVLSFLIPIAVVAVLGSAIIGFGSFLLSLNKIAAVVAALIATLAVAIIGPLLARRAEVPPA